MRKTSVLIADDHALFRQGLAALLGDNDNITVLGEAQTGREALARAAELSPDIVIMDLTMPDLNGFDATRTLRERRPDTRVIILSMHADAEYVFRAFQCGASGYLLKDSAVDEILSAIRQVDGGRRFVGAGVSADDGPDGQIDAKRSPLESLSAREREVLQLVVEGHSSAEIAATVHLSPKTVESYRSRLMKKLGVRDVTALVKFAIQHGITRLR